MRTFEFQDPVHKDTITVCREPIRDHGFSITITAHDQSQSWGVFAAPGDVALLHAWLGSAIAEYLNE